MHHKRIVLIQFSMSFYSLDLFGTISGLQGLHLYLYIIDFVQPYLQNTSLVIQDEHEITLLMFAMIQYLVCIFLHQFWLT